LRARLFEAAAVLEESLSDDGGWRLDVDMDEQDLKRLERAEGVAIRPRITQATLPSDSP